MLQLAHLPTPLDLMPRLREALGVSIPLYVKRDDCTGLALGGNKVRQLEFYFGDALEKEATLILITGAVQSNFVRTAAASAAKLGLKCIVQLEDRVPGKDDLYRQSGNVLLDRLLGAEVYHFPEGEDEEGADRALEVLAAEAKGKGERPYVIHLSEHPRPLGTLGYVAAAEELLDQADAQDIDIGTVVLASGSAVTHAGMLVGLRACGRTDIRVLGGCVRRGAELQGPRVLRVARQVELMLEREGLISEADVEVTDACLGPGYGQLNDEIRAAIRMAASLEGLILLDPVYTGKAFATGIRMLREAEPSRAVVFLHSGGTPALFAYGEAVLGAA